MASKLSDKDLRRLIVKESSDTLKKELKLGQKLLAAAEVDKIDRKSIVSYIFHLRVMANQSTKVTAEVIGFDFSKVPMMTEIEIAELEKDEGGHIQEHAQGGDSGLLMQMMTLLVKDRSDSEIRRVQALAERKVEKEQEALQKKQEFELLKAEKENEALQRQQEALQKKQDFELLKTEKEQEALLRKQELDLLKQKLFSKEKIETDRLKIESDRFDIKQKATEEDRKRQIEIREKKDFRLGRAIKSLKSLLYPMPSSHSQLLIFMRNFEELCTVHEIDADLKISVLGAFLNDKARKIVAALTADQRTNYDTFKEALLHEFNVTPRFLYRSYKNAIRTNDESFVQFTSRIIHLYSNYIESRKIEKTFEGLQAMVLADRFRESLTKEQRIFVSDHEIESPLSIQKLGLLMDHFAAERNDDDDGNNDRKKGPAINKSTGDKKKVFFCDHCGPRSSHSSNFCRLRPVQSVDKQTGNGNNYRPGVVSNRRENIPSSSFKSNDNKFNAAKSRVKSVTIVSDQESGGEDLHDDDEESENDNKEEEDDDEDQYAVNRIEIDSVSSLNKQLQDKTIEMLQVKRNEKLENHMVRLDLGVGFCDFY